MKANYFRPVAMGFVTMLTLAQAAMAAPIVYTNATVIPTLKEVGPQATWLAVESGKVLAYGSGQTYQTLKPAAVVDLQGQFLLPSLTDAHAHLSDIGEERTQVDLRGSRSWDEAAERVSAYLKKNPKSTVILGNGWDQSYWEGQRFPTRITLDKVSLSVPIILYRVDGHAAWVNTAALNASGLMKLKKDPQGGQVYRLPDGSPSGVLVDTALKPLSKLMQEVSIEQYESYIQSAVEHALSLGITSVHDAGANKRQIQAIRNLLSSKRVRFRFYEMVSAKDPKELETFLKKGPESDSENGQLSVRAVKLFADGAMGSRGAAFAEPYNDDPHNHGLMRLTKAQMLALMKKIDKAGFQIAIHAIGSLANQTALDAFETVLGKKAAEKRPRLEHAQVVREQDVARIAQLGVVASMQPTHCPSDMKWVVDRIGPERAKFAYAWRSILDAGGKLAFGSDAPVEALSPWPGLFAAETRQDRDFLPEGGFFPKQRITRFEAFQAFTEGAAYAAFSERTLGDLTPGKWADFVVTATNPLQVSTKLLHDFTVNQTYVAGKLAYQRQTETMP